MRKVFVSHYCNIPYHLLDPEINEIVKERGTYPQTFIETLYAGCFTLIRNFELSPYAQNTEIEDKVAHLIQEGKL